MNTGLSDNKPASVNDEAAIAAVLEGDRERFRELVERYQAMVFAVAWSRLGDRALAEDATQETFISAYRRLALLGGAAKFGRWLTAIARNTAIDFGIRRRAELNRRKRWLLERPEEASAEEESQDVPSAETLRQSLAELPPRHRECLVLFYLEKCSIAEAATLLGISQAALKTRLHRARHALRALMERRLARSLEQLRPTSGLAGVVMLGLPAGKPSLALAGGVLGLLAKPLPALAGSLFLAAPLAMIPLEWWVARRTAENFRDQEGFRAREFRRTSRLVLRWIVPVTLGVVGVALAVYSFFLWVDTTVWARRPHWQGLTPEMAGVAARSICGALALGYGVWLAGKWRSVVFTAHRYIIAEWLAQFCTLAGFAALALGAKASVFFVALAGNLLCAGLGHSAAPLRMDYSLFLRAARGMLRLDPAFPATPRTWPAEAQLAFARFLGRRLLARDWRPCPGGMELLLNTPGLGIATIWFSWKVGHTLILHASGEVTAHLSETGLRILAASAPAAAPDVQALEATVAAAARQALASLAAGDEGAAERVLGQSATAEIFVQHPGRAAAMPWRTAGYFVLAAAFLYFASR